MKKPTISLCMIVKNEEDVIEKCLESVKDHVDEMIIVDTGSTDRTKEIIRKFKAKLYDFKWENDFSAARNFAKKQATMDWIIQMDADEYFINDEAKQLKEAISHTAKDALSIQISNIVQENQRGTSHSYARIFRNIEELNYRYAIHEQVYHNQRQMTEEDASIRIIHTGYTTERYKKKNKNERNKKMLEAELRKNPNDGFMLFNMGNEYSFLEKHDKALEYYKKAYQNSKNRGVSFAIVQSIIRTLVKLNRKDEAVQICQEAQAIYPDYTDLYYFEGEILEEKGHYQEAKKIYEKCLQIGEANKRYLTVKGVGTIFPRERLAMIFLKERNYQKALEYMSVLIEFNKYNKDYLIQLLFILRRTFKEEEIIQYLEDIYSDSNERDLEMKMQLSLIFRMEKGISLYYEKIKQNSLVYPMLQTDFYINLLDKTNKNGRVVAQELVKSHEKVKLKLAIIYYLFTKDAVIKEKLMEKKETSIIVNALDGNGTKEGKQKIRNYSLYVELLAELMLLQKYDEIEKLLTIQKEYEPTVFKEIGDLFYRHLHDDLAMEYYVQYLHHAPNEQKVNMKVSDILYTLEMYEEAVLFAKKVFSMNRKNFAPIEIIVESYKALGKKDISLKVAEEAMTHFPNSSYLKEQEEYYF